MLDMTMQRTAATPRATVVVMLALNLILLALFILLNAFGTETDLKRDLAIEGVSDGFDYQNPAFALGSDETDEVAMPLYESLQEDIRGLLHNQLILHTAQTEADASKVRMRLPQNTLFADDNTLRPQMRGFIENIATLAAGTGEREALPTFVAVLVPVSGVQAGADRVWALGEVMVPVLGNALKMAVRTGTASDVIFEFRFTDDAAAEDAARIHLQAQPLGATVEGVAE